MLPACGDLLFVTKYSVVEQVVMGKIPVAVTLPYTSLQLAGLPSEQLCRYQPLFYKACN
jgi:hypothetical protein